MTKRARTEALLSVDSDLTSETLVSAKLAGQLAAKKADEMAPFGPGGRIAKAEVEIVVEAGDIRVTASIEAETGADAASLFAAAAAAQTLCDLAHAQIVSIRPDGPTKEGAPACPPFPRKPVAAQPTRVRASALMGEAFAQKGTYPPGDRRAAFRAFMSANHLRIGDWAEDAGVAVGVIYGFLTGTAGSIPKEDAENLAKAAGVAPEDMYK